MTGSAFWSLPRPRSRPPPPTGPEPAGCAEKFAGRENAVLLALGWFGPESRGHPPESLSAALVPLLAACADREEEVRACALDLCAVTMFSVWLALRAKSVRFMSFLS